jgi:hypothetical protein
VSHAATELLKAGDPEGAMASLQAAVRAAPLPDYCRNKTEIEGLSAAG